MEKIAVEKLDALADLGYMVLDDFIDLKFQEALRSEIRELEREGNLRKAGIGKLQLHIVKPSVRGDYIHWLGEEDEGAGNQFLRKIIELRHDLHRELFLPLKDQELHYTHYPSGTFYKRHSDVFVQQQHRVLSVILYLNENWEEKDGGRLKLYLNVDKEISIEPKSGRLLIFRSEIEHEVLLTNTDRYSITGWLLDQETGLTFL